MTALQSSMSTSVSNVSSAKLDDSVPIYSGISSGNPTLWLSKLERLFNLKGWRDELKCQMFPLYLGEMAVIWYDSLDTNVQFDYSALCTSFISKFEMSTVQKYTELTQLSSRQQQIGESVEAYYKDILTRCRHLGRTADQQFEAVLTGLQPDLQREVLKSMPKTVDDIFQVASLVESANQIAAARCATAPAPSTGVMTSSADQSSSVPSSDIQALTVQMANTNKRLDDLFK